MVYAIALQAARRARRTGSPSLDPLARQQVAPEKIPGQAGGGERGPQDRAGQYRRRAPRRDMMAGGVSASEGGVGAFRSLSPLIAQRSGKGGRAGSPARTTTTVTLSGAPLAKVISTSSSDTRSGEPRASERAISRWST